MCSLEYYTSQGGWSINDHISNSEHFNQFLKYPVLIKTSYPTLTSQATATIR